MTIRMRRLVIALCVVVAVHLATVPSRPHAQAVAASPEVRAARVEKGLLPGIVIAGRPLPAGAITERMSALKTPGVSVAVINGGVIEWAKGYGVTETGVGTSVTLQTLFQAASLSKPLAALAALRLVEQGKLALDQDVNERLTSWKVPENEFTKGEKVTLRRLLSHSAGLTVSGFPGYSAAAAVPALVQVLDGLQRIELYPESATRFFDLVEEFEIEFIRGADGAVSHMLLNGQQKAPRLPQPPAMAPSTM